MATALEVGPIVAEEDRSAFRFASKTPAAGVLCDGVTEDVALEGVLVPAPNIVWLSITEGLA